MVLTARYGHSHITHYDGIHLNGPDGRKDYTESILKIIETALSIHSDHHTSQPEYELPTANRFHVLADQGNF